MAVHPIFQLVAKMRGNNVEAETYTGIYGLHKYWSKKPHNIIRSYIMQYSHVGEIVLDPFSGSGVSIAEAIFSGRKAFGIDINPIATFITQQLLDKISPEELRSAFNQLKKLCQREINQTYEVKRGLECYIGTHFVWNEEKLEEIWYKKEGAKVVEPPEVSDIQLASSFSYDQIPYFYPHDKLFHNTRINAGPDLHIHQLFTPRNLSALALLYHHIGQIQPLTAKDVLKFCFTSALGQASKMVFIVKRRGKMDGTVAEHPKKEVGSWVIGFWVPREHFEVNVWHCFEHRFKKIFKSKQDQYALNYEAKRAKSFEELANSPSNFLLENTSARKLLIQVPDNSVDYVITDPPHGDRIPYLELSQIWNGWLGFPVDFGEEIVVSDAKGRNKDQITFNTSLTEVFREISRVLKPERHFSLIFNSLDDDLWLFILNALDSLHLKLEAVEGFRYSANSVVQDCRKRGLKSDFILTFRKSHGEDISSISVGSSQDVEHFVGMVLENNKRLETPKGNNLEILNEVIAKSLLHGKYCRIRDVFIAIEKQ